VSQRNGVERLGIGTVADRVLAEVSTTAFDVDVISPPGGVTAVVQPDSNCWPPEAIMTVEWPSELATPEPTSMKKPIDEAPGIVCGGAFMNVKTTVTS
jgi:hypothetical protein